MSSIDILKEPLEPVVPEGLASHGVFRPAEQWRNGLPVGVTMPVPARVQRPQAAEDQEEEVTSRVLYDLGPCGYLILRALGMLRDAPSWPDLLEWLHEGERAYQERGFIPAREPAPGLEPEVEPELAAATEPAVEPAVEPVTHRVSRDRDRDRGLDRDGRARAQDRPGRRRA